MSFWIATCWSVFVVVVGVVAELGAVVSKIDLLRCVVRVLKKIELLVFLLSEALRSVPRVPQRQADRVPAFEFR